MNQKQKLVLYIFVFITAGMLLYPPFQITIRGTEMNMGYGFLFDPPKRGTLVASVNVAVLLAQWFAVALISGVLWILVNENSNSDADKAKLRDSKNKSPFEKVIFALLRIIRGIIGVIFGWQIIGMFPAVTWFSDAASVTAGIFSLVFIKILMAIISGLAFFALRRVIHLLHLRWYGSLHPDLEKTFAL